MTLTASPTKLRILVADDDAETRSVLAMLVQRFDHECDEATDAYEACDLLQAKKYDLALVDINMPGNCSLELLDAADEIAPGLPIILITAVPSRETAVQAVGTQVAAYLEKPVTAERLRETIARAMAAKQEPNSQYRDLIEEVAITLRETKQNFKSRRLAALRRKAESALGVETARQD